jgi:hypothetical protein
MRPRIDGQHIIHCGYEGGIGLRRDDPALPAMRLETVFLSARPIVESLARSTMPSSTTLFSNSRNVQRARPARTSSGKIESPKSRCRHRCQVIVRAWHARARSGGAKSVPHAFCFDRSYIASCQGAGAWHGEPSIILRTCTPHGRTSTFTGLAPRAASIATSRAGSARMRMRSRSWSWRSAQR